jgi:hypothetical protein
MATTDSTLILIAPELASVDASDRIAMAELAALNVGDGFGDSKTLATAYLTAHMLTIRARNGISGAVESMKEGDLSLTYGDSGSDDNYGSTSYGKEFIRLRRACIFAPRTRAE